jgi:hypothetical protein
MSIVLNPSVTNSTMSEWFLSCNEQADMGGWFRRIAVKPQTAALLTPALTNDWTFVPLIFDIDEQHDTQLYGRQNSVQDTLCQVYEKSAAGAEAEALKLLYSEIETAFSQRNLAFVDSLLTSFNPTMVNRMVAVGLLRGTFRAKAELEAWEGCLARVSAVLIARGLPADKILRGLYKSNDKNNDKNND